MTFKSIATLDGLLRIGGFIGAILAVGWGVVRPVWTMNAKLDSLIFDICAHADPVTLRTYRSCAGITVTDPFPMSLTDDQPHP